MIYLPEGAKAMELRPLNTKMHGSPFRDRLYRNLANLLELDYGAFVFENAFDSDVWTVDIGWLAPHLAQAGREA